MNTWSGVRVLLGTPAYRRLLACRLFGQLGDGAFQIGLAGLFFFSPQRETTTAGVAWALTAALLPFTILGPFAGVLLDRWYRRNTLIVANLIRAGCVLIAATIVFTGRVDAWLLLIVLVTLSVARFILAGLGAAIPHVVARENLVLANAITPTLGTIATVLGGAIAFGLTQATSGSDSGGTAALVFTLLTYLAAAVVVHRLRTAQLGPDGGPQPGPVGEQLIGVLRDTAHGARHVWQRQAARWSMVLTAGIRLPFALFIIVSILASRNSFTDSVSAGMQLVGLVGGLAGLGAGLAAVVVPSGVGALGVRLWTACCLLVIAGVCGAFAVAMSATTLLLAALPLGLAVQGVKVCVDTTVQLAVDDDHLGRAFTLYDMVFNTAFVLASLLAVALVPATGLSGTVWTGLLGLTVVLALGQLRRPRSATV